MRKLFLALSFTALILGQPLPSIASELRPPVPFEENLSSLLAAVSLEDQILANELSLAANSSGVAIYTPNGEIDIRLIGGQHIEVEQLDTIQNAAEFDERTPLLSVSKETGVQLIGVISDESKPEKYAFNIQGDFETIKIYDTGLVVLLDTNGRLLGGFYPPWAIDSTGKEVRTHYELEGNTLVQTVEHHISENLSYPIIFDPNFTYSSGVLSQSRDQSYSGGGMQVSAWLSPWGRLLYSVDSRFFTTEAWALLRKNHWQVRDSRWATSLKQQWECHILGGWLEWDSWDLETKRPANPDWPSRIWNSLLTPSAVCNW